MIKSRNPEYLAYTRLMMERNQFLRHVGVEITSIKEGEVEAELEFEKRHEQQNGFVHGGVTSTLCDMVMGFASYSLVEQGQKVFTVEIKVSYYNPGIGDKIFARGWVEKAGRRFHFCESEVYIRNGHERKIIAKATTTMAVI